MKVSNIMPVSLLKHYGDKTNYHMTIPSYIEESDEYANYFYNRATYEDFVMVDTAVVELGYPMPFPRIVDLAKRVNASEVMLPDYSFNSERTYNETVNSYHHYINNYGDIPFQIHGVPQGETLIDYLNCFYKMSKLGFIDTIGISATTDVYSELELGRVTLINLLEDLGLIDESKEYHLLGYLMRQKGPSDKIKMIADKKWIRGIDTRTPITFAYNGFDLKGSIDRPKRSPDMFEDVEPRDLYSYNIDVFKKWCRYDYS